MKKLICLSIATFSFFTSAELIVKDLNIVGDGLVIHDTESNLEWLKPTKTYSKTPKDSLMYIYSRMQETNSPYYMSALGNDLLGWRIANKQELQSLYSNVYRNNESGHLDRRAEFISKIGITQGQLTSYCKFTPTTQPSNPTSCHLVKYNDVTSFLTVENFDGVWSNYQQPRQNSNVPVWVVRGVQSDNGNDNCPTQNPDMSRIQAIEYIQHLATQLSDPNTTVITSLNF